MPEPTPNARLLIHPGCKCPVCKNPQSGTSYAVVERVWGNLLSLLNDRDVREPTIVIWAANHGTKEEKEIVKTYLIKELISVADKYSKTCLGWKGSMFVTWDMWNLSSRRSVLLPKGSILFPKAKADYATFVTQIGLSHFFNDSFSLSAGKCARCSHSVSFSPGNNVIDRLMKGRERPYNAPMAVPVAVYEDKTVCSSRCADVRCHVCAARVNFPTEEEGLPAFFKTLADMKFPPKPGLLCVSCRPKRWLDQIKSPAKVKLQSSILDFMDA